MQSSEGFPHFLSCFLSFFSRPIITVSHSAIVSHLTTACRADTAPLAAFGQFSSRCRPLSVVWSIFTLHHHVIRSLISFFLGCSLTYHLSVLGLCPLFTASSRGLVNCAASTAMLFDFPALLTKEFQTFRLLVVIAPPCSCFELDGISPSLSLSSHLLSFFSSHVDLKLLETYVAEIHTQLQRRQKEYKKRIKILNERE